MGLFAAARFVVCYGHAAGGLADPGGADPGGDDRARARTHGQIIRHAEQADVTALLSREDLAALTSQLVPTQRPRRQAGWPPDLNAVVDAALITGATRPPPGVTAADWERVLTARRQEHTCSVAELRHLGLEVVPDQVLIFLCKSKTEESVDDIECFPYDKRPRQTV
jgi:hypothetical protein